MSANTGRSIILLHKLFPADKEPIHQRPDWFPLKYVPSFSLERNRYPWVLSAANADTTMGFNPVDTFDRQGKFGFRG